MLAIYGGVLQTSSGLSLDSITPISTGSFCVGRVWFEEPRWAA